MTTSQIPRSVAITGARGALGSQVLKRFLDAGCRVIAIDRTPPADRGDIQWIELDVTDPKAVRERMPTDVDALIHCAGGFRYTSVESFRDEDLDFLLNTNLKSAFLLARQVIPSMKNRNFGRIVFVGAKATLHPSAGMGLYSASKAGLNILTASLADELREFNINVNAVLPSIIDTPANRADMPKADFSKWVGAGELAELIFSLTQPLTGSMNGALIPVNGRV